MSEYAQLELIHSLPQYLVGIAALLAAWISWKSYKTSLHNKAAIGEVKHELNSLLEARVAAAQDVGRIAERAEQRAANIEAKKP